MGDLLRVVFGWVDTNPRLVVSVLVAALIGGGIGGGAYTKALHADLNAIREDRERDIAAARQEGAVMLDLMVAELRGRDSELTMLRDRFSSVDSVLTDVIDRAADLSVADVVQSLEIERTALRATSDLARTFHLGGVQFSDEPGFPLKRPGGLQPITVPRVLPYVAFAVILFVLLIAVAMWTGGRRSKKADTREIND
jgi:hypothetical protein